MDVPEAGRERVARLDTGGDKLSQKSRALAGEVTHALNLARPATHQPRTFCCQFRLEGGGSNNAPDIWSREGFVALVIDGPLDVTELMTAAMVERINKLGVSLFLMVIGQGGVLAGTNPARAQSPPLPDLPTNCGSFTPLSMPTLPAEAEPIAPTGKPDKDAENRELARQLAVTQQVLQLTEGIDDPQQTIDTLLSAAFTYINLGQASEASELLARALDTTDVLTDDRDRSSALQTIASYYGILGEADLATEALDRAVALAEAQEDASVKASYLAQLALTAMQAGQCQYAETLLAQSQDLVLASAEPETAFPFQAAEPITGSVGLAGAFSSFTNTTAFFGVNGTLSKLWPRDDITFDGTISASFDRSREGNNPRYGGQIFNVYRHHFSPRWNLFSDLFVTGNDFYFAPATGDDDLSYTVTLVTGGGISLYRRTDPRRYADWQIGFGGRYDYTEVDFELLENQVRPIFYTGLLAQGVGIGPGRLGQTLGFSLPVNNPNAFNLISRTSLNFPLGEKWVLNGTFTFRYLNQAVLEGNPRVRTTFRTGLNYRF